MQKYLIEWAIKILIEALKKYLTPDTFKQACTMLVNWLAEQAKKTDTKIDDDLVKVVAAALGVPVPVKA